MKTNIARMVVVGAAALASLGTMSANPVLILWDPAGGSFVQIGDNSVSDGSIIPGLISWSGAVGSSWIGSVTVGTTKPTTGTIPFPELTLSGTVVSAAHAGVLRVSLSDDSFGPLPLGSSFAASVAGNKAGNLSYFTYADASNALADGALPFSGGPGRAVNLTQILESGVPGYGPFSATTAATYGGAGYPYSLTMDVIVNHLSNDLVEKTCFTATLSRQHIPDGGSLLGILGSTIVCLAWWARRRSAA